MGEHVENTTNDDTDTSSIDTKDWSQENDPKDNSKVVKQRGDGRNQEASMGLDDAGKKGTNSEKHLTDKHDAHQIGHDATFFLWKVRNQLANWAGEDKKEGNDEGHEEEERVKSGIDESISFFVTLLEIFGINRNKSGREGTNN